MRYESIGIVHGSAFLRTDQEDLSFVMMILRGSPPPFKSPDGVTLQGLLGMPQLSIAFEMVDGYCLDGQLRDGARILEWAKATAVGGAMREHWNVLKNHAERNSKVRRYFLHQTFRVD
jgi:hypothetical protein